MSEMQFPSSPAVGSTKVLRRDASQVLFAKGRGALVQDERARFYLDFSCGVGAVSLGHADVDFTARMAEAIGNGLSFPGYGEVHARLTSALLEGTHDSCVVSLFKTSSEAVNAALRLAAAETSRLGVIRCGYTGQADRQIAASPGWHEPLHSPLRGAIREVPGCRGLSGNELVADWIDLDPESLQQLLDQHPRRFGAMVIDAYQIELASTEAILTGTRTCRQAGQIVILDETKTAGRCGPRGSWEHVLSKLAQYVILGKAIGNGAPISVLLGPDSLGDLYRASRIGGTHSKETFGAYAALSTIEIMRERDGYNKLARIGHEVVETLNLAAGAAGVSEHLAVVPMLGGRLFELAFSRQTIGAPAARKELVMCLLDEGVVALEGHCSFINLAHGEIDHELLYDQIKAALVKWRTSSTLKV